MKLAARHKELIAYLYGTPGFSPLEIAAELGLTFRQVCAFIDRKCLRPTDFMIARGVQKATRAHISPVEDRGFTSPFWRVQCS